MKRCISNSPPRKLKRNVNFTLPIRRARSESPTSRPVRSRLLEPTIPVFTFEGWDWSDSDSTGYHTEESDDSNYSSDSDSSNSDSSDSDDSDSGYQSSRFSYDSDDPDLKDIFKYFGLA
jgi:hypothetical protein